MAEVDVVFVLQKLAYLINEEAHLFHGVHDHVESILKEMHRLMMFLEDVEGSRGDDRVRFWLRELRDVARYVEDIVETFVFKVATPQNVTRRRFICFAIFAELMAHRKIGKAHRLSLHKEIKQIKIKIRDIDELRFLYGLGDVGLGSSRTTSIQRLREWRLTPPPSIVGFEEDVKRLVALLNNPDPRLQVIIIVGMAGSGKTTLAKKIYCKDHDNVKVYFDCHVWIHASKGCEPMQLLEDMGKQMLGPELEVSSEKMNVEDLVVRISDFLKNKRYLIVLDDVWDVAVWVAVRSALPDGMNGSRILVNTRDREVAFLFNLDCRHHKLSLLNENVSWELFCNKAFSEGCGCPTELEKLGKQIVASCGGLPLAIAEIGEFLSRRKKTPNVWSFVLENIHSKPYSLLKRCSQLLALSYHNIPYNLKWCFLYCCIFPEGYEIHARNLIWMWVAEGFVHGRCGRTSEQIGEDYLKRLINKNMIQVTRKGADGRIKRCRVHPLMRSIAISEAKEVGFVTIYTDSDFEFPIGARRLAIHSSIHKYIPLVHSSLQIRTLVCFNKDEDYLLQNKQLEFVCGGLKLLRVLDLEFVQLPELLDVIGTLVNLRYIGLKQAGLKELPSTICKLPNLQTMDLRHNSLIGLPLEIGNLQRLRCLDIRHNLITSLPNSICRIQELRHLNMDDNVECGHLQFHTLTNLESLPVARAGGWIDDGLHNLINLRRLGVYGGFVEFNVSIWKSVLNLRHLCSLKLEAFRLIPLPSSMSSLQHLSKLHLSGQLQKLLDSQDFPASITQLSLSWSRLEQDPMSTLEKMPKLKILTLKMKAYVGKEMVCSTGGFPRLKFLELEQLQKLRKWKIEQGALAKLNRLSISWCLKLKMVPEGLRYVTTLRALEVHWMPPKFKARLQQDKGKDWFKIQHVHSIVVEGTPFT